MNPSISQARDRHSDPYLRSLRLNAKFMKSYGDRYVDVASYSPTIARSTLTSDEIGAVMMRHRDSVRAYPGPGLTDLRVKFVDFLNRIYGIEVSPSSEIAVCAGVTQAYDATSRSFDGRYVFVPQYAIPPAKAIPVANGNELIEIPMSTDSFELDLDKFEQAILATPEQERKYVYLNFPNNPTGANITLNDVQRILGIAREANVPIVHDHDIYFASYSPDKPIISFLQSQDAEPYCVELYTFTKEFGLPGLRVGLAVGHQELISKIRIHNDEFKVMPLELSQHIAVAALEKVEPTDIQRQMQQTASYLIQNFRRLGEVTSIGV